MGDLIYNSGGRKFVAFAACFIVVVISHFAGKDCEKLAGALLMILGPYVGANVAQKFSPPEKIVNINAGPAKK